MARIETHEQVCTRRYNEIEARLIRIEKIMLGTTGTLLIGMAGIILRGLHLL